MLARGVSTLFAVMILVGVAFASPVFASELQPLQAKHFIVGKLWSYRCFDGTKGSGRALADGSIGGTFQERGSGPTLTRSLPPGTIKADAYSICAPGHRFMGLFTPCFTVNQRDEQRFRGSIVWLPFLYCDFERITPRQTSLNSE